MKKTIFTLFLSIIILNIPILSFAEDFYGWWKAEQKQINTPDLLKITDTRFAGLQYKIVEKKW